MSKFLTPRFVIALLVLALFGGAIIVMSFFSVPEQNQEVVIQLVGGVNALAGLVIGHYFGSMSREGPPQEVSVVNPPNDPVHTDDIKGGAA